MIRLIFFIFIFAADFFASTTVTENDPSTLVNGVSVITGDLFTYEEDYRVQGLEPISIRRSYVSSSGGGNFLPHLEATYFIDAEFFVISEPNGTAIKYFLADRIRKKQRLGKKPMPKSVRFNADWNHLSGVTNTASGTISAHTNYKNQHIVSFPEERYIFLYAADGTKRTYFLKSQQKTVDTGFGKNYVVIGYLLHTEELPSGHSIKYHWNDQDQLYAISTTTRKGSLLAIVRQDQTPKMNKFFGSDGRTLCYTKGYVHQDGKKYECLQEIDSPDSPHQTIGRIVKKSKKRGIEKLFLTSITLPQGRSVLVEYEKVDSLHYRVKQLFDQNHQLINSFGYGKRETHVTDANHNVTVYRYNDDQRLTSIETYEGIFHQLHHSERFVWDGIHIRCKTYLNGQGQAEYARTFTYDERGNVLEETLWGNLSGNGQPLQFNDQGMPIDNGAERCIKRTEYTEDGRNLPKRQEDSNGSITQFEYIPNTHLITSKVVYDREEAKIRYSYEYDDELILIREMVDDGITQRVRHIYPRKENTYYGLPNIIEEKYHDGEKEILLGKTSFSYGKGALIEKKSIFDAQGKHSYDVLCQYDQKGNLVSETNALGWQSKAQYDLLGNKTYAQEANGSVHLFNYDLSNQLVFKETTGFDGLKRNFTYEYNALHHLSLEQDSNGAQTRYVTNAFGNRLETIRPDGSILRSEFDSLGREVKKADADGFATQIHYNAYGQPISIQHPDGAEEKNSYFLDGSFQSTTDAAGVETKYTRDYLGRVTSKTIEQQGQILAQETYTYTGQFLTSTTDAEGHITKLFYDRGGRKIREERKGEQICYEYDSLGRVHVVEKRGVRTVTNYDLLNRVIEECEEESKTHQTIRSVRYAHDRSGNKTDEWKWVANEETHDQFVYDSQNRLIRHINPLGAERKILYEDSFCREGQNILRKTEIDPMGLQTIELYDSLARVILLEKQNRKILLQCHKNYNGQGQLIEQTDRIFAPDGTSRTINTQWEYDSRKRLVRQIEAAAAIEAKITKYTYTPRGEKKTTTKPDGVTLFYEYNGLGANTSIRSSDGTIHHIFVYNRLGELIQHDGITREVDAHGRILVEMFPNFRIENKYNSQGQRIEWRIPQANCLVEYGYYGKDLSSITRKTLQGEPVYTHRYLQRDLSGNLLEAERADGLTISFSYDLCFRKQSIQTPQYHQQILGSDRLGNILQLKTLKDESIFTYDELYQITSERGLFNHDYALDTLHCRLQKDDESYQVNALNQLVSHIEYDKNGNPSRKGNTFYLFDALDRLIQIQTPEGIEKYTYDALHRRIRTETEHEVRYFLYDGQNEIGSFDEKLELQELRILADTPHSEIGASIGIEMKGFVYIPIHDLSGNIAALIPLHGGDSEITHYSAYGEEIGSQLSPWRFSSKRTDVTGLVYYGRRFYQPNLGRWLSPDPAGFTDGMNLYAFVGNCPLTHFDDYGLFMFQNQTCNYTNLGSIGFPHSMQYLQFQRSYRYMEYPSNSRIFPSLTPDSNLAPVYFVNGMNNTKEECILSAQALKQSLGGKANVYPAYSESWGHINDLVSVSKSRSKSNYSTPFIRMFRTSLLNDIRRLEAENSLLKIFINCFSRGSTDVYHTVKNFTRAEKDRLIIISCGGIKILSRDLGFKVNNLISKGDWCSLHFHPELKKNPEAYDDWAKVYLLDQKDGFTGFIKDHFALSRTYQEGIKDYGKKLYEKYGGDQ